MSVKEELTNMTCIIYWKKMGSNAIGFKVSFCCNELRRAHDEGRVVDIPFNMIGFKDGVAFKHCPYCMSPIKDQEVEEFPKKEFKGIDQ